MNVETFEIAKIDLEMPKSAENVEEVDFSKASLVVKIQNKSPLKLQLNLPPGHTLNTEAPNSWRLESQTNSLVKGKVPESLKFEIPESLGIVADILTLVLKLYLCSNGVCTVRNKKLCFN